ncbi:hypothetical protein OLMES_3945 [Oleiphilus messinensis]|uniref:PEP-CTERM protein-sorting domain-containing protein n=1 Tax=Oleiphilus messinensis TaxID=141451 RepID=A0A1Y0IF28_9GAMM|nr:hypothetical protein [Oleiphilus messinensis]ARU57964.1 hypothetical protein OLMES_3945 [Oleiphilus messinensis]
MKQAFSTIALATLVTGAHATPVTFFGEDLNNSNSVRLASTPNADAAFTEFTSNLTGFRIEDFESLSTGITSAISLEFPGSSGAINATLSGSSMSIVNVPPGTTNRAGRYPISGNQFLETNVENFRIDFSQAISAFGFWGVDIGDFGGTVSLELIGGGIQTIEVPNTQGEAGSTDGSVLFFGFYDLSDSFTSITFDITSNGDVFAFDDALVGDAGQINPAESNPVPIPATTLLLGGGFLMMRRFLIRL